MVISHPFFRAELVPRGRSPVHPELMSHHYRNSCPSAVLTNALWGTTVLFHRGNILFCQMGNQAFLGGIPIVSVRLISPIHISCSYAS